MGARCAGDVEGIGTGGVRLTNGLCLSLVMSPSTSSLILSLSKDEHVAQGER